MDDILWDVDWQGIFVPGKSLLEMFIRGTIMFFVVLVLLRVVLKRQSGMLGTTDVLVVVLVAEVAGNGMSAGYHSVVEGAALVGTILFWTYAIDWLAHRFPPFARLTHPRTLLLVEDGKVLLKNMRAELITRDELMAQLRENGIDDLAKVKRACIEADGMISVIKMDA